MDFKIYEHAFEMFRQCNCIGQYNCIFTAMKNTNDEGIQAGLSVGKFRAAGSAIGDALTANNALNNMVYDGMLINQTENGFGFIPLRNKSVSLTANANKMEAFPNEFFFVGNNFITQIEVKNWAIFNKKVKKVNFNLSNGTKIKLMIRLEEKDVPYQFQNFSAFVSRFQK